MTTGRSEDEASGAHVRSFARGLAVIRAFGEGHASLTLSDVARETGITRAAARRFLLTLVDLGYVTVHERHFSLTPRVLELGYAYLSSAELPELAGPHLERLVAETGESSSVSVLDGHQVVYVARVTTSRLMRVSIAVGTRFPAWVTSMGRVLLAGLSEDALRDHLAEVERTPYTAATTTGLEPLVRIVGEVREAGYALVENELEEGLRSLAAPIRDADGRVVAAMNLSTHATRIPTETVMATHLPALRRTAEELGVDLARVQRSTRPR